MSEAGTDLTFWTVLFKKPNIKDMVAKVNFWSRHIIHLISACTLAKKQKHPDMNCVTSSKKREKFSSINWYLTLQQKEKTWYSKRIQKEMSINCNFLRILNRFVSQGCISKLQNFSPPVLKHCTHILTHT